MGMDLVTCAAQYSVSALVSLSGSATAAAESTPAVTTPAATEASGTVTAFTDLGTTPYAASTGTKGLNYTATASATIAAFTGAASKYNTYGVLSAVVLGLAGLIVGL
ncbi:hypothetical protein MMC30_007112 [Trapelia coarctata]|nr:hypothetical protein [Trapelia coarctata]